VCRSKHVELLINIGIINSSKQLHLVGYFSIIVRKVFVCGQTIKSMIDAVRTETHEVNENCCVFLQSKLTQVKQTFCFYLKVA
jgi:hypothetical protein